MLWGNTVASLAAGGLVPPYIELSNEPDGDWNTYISPANYNTLVKLTRGGVERPRADGRGHRRAQPVEPRLGQSQLYLDRSVGQPGGGFAGCLGVAHVGRRRRVRRWGVLRRQQLARFRRFSRRPRPDAAQVHHRVRHQGEHVPRGDLSPSRRVPGVQRHELDAVRRPCLRERPGPAERRGPTCRSFGRPRTSPGRRRAGG